ncbi:MAG: hypothetical protein HKM93_00710 [Desulfobacteraceae bacterium]|nr:hypothetical protein [Desulfobacteraceae bacterium]
MPLEIKQRLDEYKVNPVKVFLILCLLAVPGLTMPAADTAPSALSFDWGGRVKAAGTRFFPEAGTLYHDVDSGPYDDVSLDARLNLAVISDTGAQLDIHYETIFAGGDFREVRTTLLGGGTPGSGLFPDQTVEDDRRLMDLTATIYENDRQYGYHRIDRLVLTLTPAWGTLRIGRQALTWGNGLIFNPMDVFNPFSPTDVDRDYKVGDDMIAGTLLTPGGGEIQLVGVARKAPDDADVEVDNASFAIKYHDMVNSLEYDIMGARHFEDYILGLGTSGYLKDAAWRMDATYTFLADGRSDPGFWSYMANLDYSWVWWDKNLYGLIEFYTNTLGVDHPMDALSNPDLIERVARGEIHTLGMSYLGASVQIELHPLVNLHLTSITDLHGPSGILQPRLIWDVRDNLQLTTGVNKYWGGGDTEFGGFSLPFTDTQLKPLDGIYLWLTCFF